MNKYINNINNNYNSFNSNNNNLCNNNDNINNSDKNLVFEELFFKGVFKAVRRGRDVDVPL